MPIHSIKAFSKEIKQELPFNVYFIPLNNLCKRYYLNSRTLTMTIKLSFSDIYFENGITA